MNKNRPHDESEHPSPKQGTRKDRIEVLLARIEDQINIRQDISYDELSAYKLAQLQAKYLDLYVRLLTLLVKVKDD